MCYTIPRTMKTVLYLRAAQRGCCSQVIDGASRYAREHGWVMLDISHPVETENIRILFNAYSPSGVLVDSPIGRLPDGLRLCKGLPAVVHNPISFRTALPVFKHDQRRIAELAAKELFELGLVNFAYVEYMKRESWSVERGKAFKRTRQDICQLPKRIVERVSPKPPQARRHIRGKRSDGSAGDGRRCIFRH